jgi:hypothetical protein
MLDHSKQNKHPNSYEQQQLRFNDISFTQHNVSRPLRHSTTISKHHQEWTAHSWSRSRYAILFMDPHDIASENLTAAIGIGLTAKFIEEGGADLIIIYNSGRFRMAGRGSLAGLMPYGNANDVVVDMVNMK